MAISYTVMKSRLSKSSLWVALQLVSAVAAPSTAGAQTPSTPPPATAGVTAAVRHNPLVAPVVALRAATATGAHAAGRVFAAFRGGQGSFRSGGQGSFGGGQGTAGGGQGAVRNGGQGAVRTGGGQGAVAASTPRAPGAIRRFFSGGQGTAGGGGQGTARGGGGQGSFRGG